MSKRPSLSHPPGPGRRARTERDPGHRPVERDRYGAADGLDVGRSGCRTVSRSQHRHLVAARKHRRQVLHMVLYPARNVQRVRTDQPDPHWACESMSAENTAWSMCQSAGQRRMPVVNRSATSCVIEASPALPRRTAIGSLKSRASSGPRNVRVRATSGAPGHPGQCGRPAREAGPARPAGRPRCPAR